MIKEENINFLSFICRAEEIKMAIKKGTDKGYILKSVEIISEMRADEERIYNFKVCFYGKLIENMEENNE